ncbi:MAG: MAPEG family protein [Robiginitomaculum sp.]|nr:MAPEG family protein [Robiginitomaculum sp.]MDQ7076575.1 MAPEG family protein [Robiginitomaculum sp.]
MEPLSPDLFWLAATAIMTMLLWVPHISWLILQEGLIPALMDGNHALQVKPKWAKRAQKAHTNATDNLAAFGILVLVAHLAGIDPAATGQLAMYYFVLRALHYSVYVMGLPVIRTVLYLAAIGVEVAIAMQFLG